MSDKDTLICCMQYLLPDEVTHFARRVNCQWREASHSPALWSILRGANGVAEGLIIDSSGPLAERRSKGSVYRARLQGIESRTCAHFPPQQIARHPTPESCQVYVITRTISLETTNAGHDDGVPTSALRDISLAAHAEHPNVVRYHGAQVKGAMFQTVCEYLPYSLASYITALHKSERWKDSQAFRSNTIRRIMTQILEGLKHLHHRGVFHRNLKPENVVLYDEASSLDDPELEEAPCHCKIADLSMGRTLSVPSGHYTPEDPKERDRSFREQRRLNYRAPELILRAPAYGVEVDMWAAGCIMAEIVTGNPLFRSDAEIGLLFRMLQVVGTPHVSEWRTLCPDEELILELPQWQPIDFRSQ